jgi:hypothetical protein
MRNVFACVLLLLLCSAAAFGQAASGNAAISGVVRDPSGATVPGANVVISSEGRGVIRTLTTNEAGVFSAPALVPGPGYKVAVTAPGFAGYEAKDIELRVGQNLELNIALKIATTATTVEVTAAAPLVEYSKSDISSIVDTRQISELPINGRRVDTFVLLTPGVSNDGTYGLLTFRGVAGQNSFLVDGVDTTEQFYNENAGRTRIASQLAQEAVDQFQVVSSNYTAEYGRAMGGVVNTITKSGTNTFHGSAFWFYRSPGFNARDPFSTFVPADKRNQAGGSIGGPIQKDKLFFFLSSEVSRRDFPIAGSLNTTAVNGATQSWNLCGVGTSTVPAASAAQCAAIATLLPRFYGQIPRTLNQELYLAKLDYRLSSRNTLSASFNFLHALSPNGIQTSSSLTTGSQITSNGDDAVTVRNGRIQWIAAASSAFMNEFRFGLATDRQADTFDNALLGPGLGYLAVSVNGTGLGSTTYLPRIEPMERRFQFIDNATWVKGTHTIKFGVDIATTRDYVYYISNYNGSYSYTTVNAFALDYSGNTTGAKHWNSFTQTFGNPAVQYTINDLGFYLQDQWRVTKRLMINYGARYEYPQISQPTVCNQDYPLTCKVPSPNTNLAPRVGISYRLNDKTVLQGGYGMFYARFQGGTLDDLYTSGNGVYQTSVSLAASQAAQLAVGPVFPNILSAAPTGGTVSAASIQMLAPNIKTPYSEQANVGIQRQLTSDIVVSVSYLWSRGAQLYGIRDLNMPTATTNYTYTIVDASGNTTGTYTTPVYIGKRPDTRYGTIAYAENGVDSYYNGLAVVANKRFSHGIQFQTSYTWAHEIDDGQNYGESTNNLWLSSPTYWLVNGNYGLDKGSGNLDQRHRFTLSWVWAPTITKRSSAFFKYAVNGWQFSNITTFASGHPYGSTQVYVTDTPVSGMFSNYTLNGSGFSSRVPWLPAQNYYMPATYRADVRLSKVFPVTERGYKLYLTCDVFNVANNWSATGFTSSRAYQEAKGVITATPSLLYVPSAAYGSPDGTQARRLQIGIRFTF